MKKNLIYIASFLAFFTFGCNSESPKETPLVNNQSSVPSEITIGVIDTDSIFAKYDMVLDVMGELELTEKRLSSDIQGQAQQLEKEFQNYLNIGATLTLSEQTKREEQFKKREQDIQALGQRYSDQLLTLRAQRNQEVENQLFKFIDNYNKEHYNFTLILSKARTSGVLYSAPTLDITAEVIDALNAEYAKNRSKK